MSKKDKQAAEAQAKKELAFKLMEEHAARQARRSFEDHYARYIQRWQQQWQQSPYRYRPNGQ